MTTFRNHRNEPYFTFLKNGQKTVEGRLAKGKYATVTKGDLINVFNDNESESVMVEVLRVNRYKSFEEMLSKENLSQVLPDVGNISDGVAVYRKFYTENDELRFGVVAIEIKLIGEK